MWFDIPITSIGFPVRIRRIEPDEATSPVARVVQEVEKVSVERFEGDVSEMVKYLFQCAFTQAGTTEL